MRYLWDRFYARFGAAQHNLQKGKGCPAAHSAAKEAHFNVRESRKTYHDIEVDIPFEKAGNKKEAMALLLRTGKVLEVSYSDGEDVIVMNGKKSFSLKAYLNAAEAGKLPPAC